MKTLIIILATALLLIPTAYADTESHSESTDSLGTKVTTNAKSKDSVGLTGTRLIETEAKTVRDPKGLMNKTTESYEHQAKIGSDGDVAETTKSVDTAGTARESNVEKNVSKNWFDSGTTTTVTRKEVTDPKGMLNKTETEIENKTTRNADGTIAEKSVTRKINGDKVFESKTP